MATLTPPSSFSFEAYELLLITQPTLREQLLQARLIDDFSARSVVQRGNQVYLSLREIRDPAERQAVNWAILKLQMGGKIPPQELPAPLRKALTAVPATPSPLIESLIWGSVCGVVGGVLMMALAGLAITVLNVPPESFAGIMATAVAFVLAATAVGLGATIYFWRKLSSRNQLPAKPTHSKPQKVI